jgi:hypothetical protein
MGVKQCQKDNSNNGYLFLTYCLGLKKSYYVKYDLDIPHSFVFCDLLFTTLLRDSLDSFGGLLKNFPK